MDSPFVTMSGPGTVNQVAQFVAGGSRVYTYTFDLQNDENALEDVETLMLRLENPSDPRAVFSSQSVVMVTDEDG